MKIMKSNGFTQSQTLLITGTVFLILFALIAVPFYNSWQKKQMIAKLRTLQSNLLQADKMASLILGVNYEEFDISLPVKAFASRYFTPYMNIIASCTGSDNECWNEVQYKDLSGKKYYAKISYSIILADKTVVGFSKDKNGLMSIIADLNGKTGANTLGRDVFVFYIYNDKMQPELCEHSKVGNVYLKNGIHLGGYDRCGVPHDINIYKELFSPALADGCNKKAPHNPNGPGIGAACSALIYKSSWNMDSVYPW